MTLKSYYNNLTENEKRAFVKLIMRKTGCSLATFYYWLSNKYKNNMTLPTRDVISKITGIPSEHLFEETVKENKA